MVRVRFRRQTSSDGIRWRTNGTGRFTFVRRSVGLGFHRLWGQRGSIAHTIAVPEGPIFPFLERSAEPVL